MNDVLMLTAYLVGASVDPLTWGVALLILALSRGKPLGLRVGLAVAVFVVAAGTIYVGADEPQGFGKPLVMGAIATAIWALIFAGIGHVLPKGPVWGGG